jgi:hypothetical protein
MFGLIFVAVIPSIPGRTIRSQRRRRGVQSHAVSEYWIQLSEIG